MPEGTYLGDHLAILIAALLLGAMAGGPRRLYQAAHAYLPARQLSNLVRFLEKRLNRERRAAEERRMRGLILAAFLLLSVLALGALLSGFFRALQYGVVLEVVLVATLLALRPTYDRAQEVALALAEDDVAAARAAFEGTIWRNAALLDEYGTARAAMELLAMHFAGKVVAPVFWYALLGLPGLLASRLITLLYEILAQNTAQQATFGWASHQMHRWAMALPHALAALLLLPATLVSPTARPRQAARALMLQANYPGLEAMLLAPIPVLAAACDVALGGPASVYAGGDWVGRGTLRPKTPELRKAMLIYVFASVVLVVLLSAAA